MKRLLLLLACLLALCTTVVAAEPAISDMKTDCTLTGSGACQVTQTFTMEIDGAQMRLIRRDEPREHHPVTELGCQPRDLLLDLRVARGAPRTPGLSEDDLHVDDDEPGVV